MTLAHGEVRQALVRIPDLRGVGLSMHERDRLTEVRRPPALIAAIPINAIKFGEIASHLVAS